MSRRPTFDTTCTIVVAPAKFCPRRLKPAGPNAKRYMSIGPLHGYMLACPSCGFIELHTHEAAGFAEEDGGLVRVQLVSTARPVTCMLCQRIITLAGGTMMAVART